VKREFLYVSHYHLYVVITISRKTS